MHIKFAFSFPDDAYMLDWEGQRARPLRAFLPRSFSAPYPPLEGIAEGIEDAEDDDNGTLLSESQTPNGEDMNGPDMTPIMNEASDPIGIHCDYQGPTVEVDASPTVEDIQQAMRVETYILGLLQRYCLSQTLTTTQDLSSTPDFWQELPDYPNNHCEQPDNPEWQEWDLFNDEKTSQDRYYLEVEADQFSQACKDPGFSLDTSTIVADADSRCHYHPSLSPPLLFESPKQDWEPTCLKMAHQVPIARLYQEENWSSVGATSLSQSEGNFHPQGLTTKLEHGYHKLGQDLDVPCFNKDYLSSQRLWSSSTDFSQEETEKLLRIEEQLLRDTHLPFHINSHSGPKHTEQDDLIRSETNARGPQVDGPDTSLSETCSPGSSSTSSDSDESGGLVWPQQVPPYVPSLSQNEPTAMVKIKASHALKKKILRFRSGSLKVMTTV